MKYADGEAFRAALEARLAQPGPDGADLARRRRTIAFDRLLARLAVADHDSWLLKGGAALEFRFAGTARTTKDIDLALLEQSEPMDVLLDDLAGDPFGDHFEFVMTRQRKLTEQDDRGPVVRMSVEARLGGRTFERFVIDIVTPTQAPETTEWIELGKRLSFADMPVVALPVINLETHWAEKLSAYVRRYHDRPNTRVKDLVDLVLLIDQGLEPGRAVRNAVYRTFTARNQPVPGATVPSMAAQWEDAFASAATELDLTTTDSFEAHASVERFWLQCNAANEGETNAR